MNLIAPPAFTDHPAWMLHDGHYAGVVDPGASAPPFAARAAQQRVLAAILVTHHHAGLHPASPAEAAALAAAARPWKNALR